jgi:predicted small secreted protein
MYSDRKKKKTGLPALLLAVLLLTAAVFYGFGGSGRDISEEGAAAIHETVRRAALQCCVVEGVYPPDLQYLQDNYGLQINTEDYYVVYDCFASNLPPTIRVVPRAAQGRG